MQMSKEFAASKYLQFGRGSLTQEQIDAIQDENPIEILQKHLGLPQEFRKRVLINEYYATDYAALLAEYDVALSGIATDQSAGAWKVIRQIAEEIATHPHVLRHTRGLTFDLQTKDWLKDEAFERAKQQNISLILQSAELLVS